MPEIAQWLSIALHAAREAGVKIMAVRSDPLPGLKSDRSPVTAADKASDHVIREVLGNTGLPVVSEEGPVVPYEERRKWTYYWLIDPLDGTKEYLNGIPEFTVNIALIFQGRAVAGVVYVPPEEVMYYGSGETGVFKSNKGSLMTFPPLIQKITIDDLLKKEDVIVAGSRSHFTTATNDFLHQFKHTTLFSIGSSLKFMLLLEGKVDIYPRLGNTMEWDTAAPHAILNAVNRGVYHTDLKCELNYNKPDPVNPFFIAF